MSSKKKISVENRLGEPEEEIWVTDNNWVPLGPDRYPEYRIGRKEFQATVEILESSDSKARIRRDAVRDAMKHAWNGYKTYAWGQDELLPKSKKGQNNWGGMGTTLVDSLDTLWLMGMKDEFWEARDWVRDHLKSDNFKEQSVFETTIRSLGGLLSAYDWSGDKIFLEKAEELGKKLACAFNTPGGIPVTNIRSTSCSNLKGSADGITIAEAGTLQVEFRYLSKAIGNPDYATKSERVYEILNALQPPDTGLFPFIISNANKETVFLGNTIGFGANGDSFYEYMLKIWLQGGKKEPMYRDMYDKAMDGLHENLIQKTRSGLTYIAEMKNHELVHKMDHLACFMAGSLALGAYTHPDGVDSLLAQRDLETGKSLAYTCYQMYARMKSGIAPELVRFVNGKMSAGPPSKYILRPEAVESFFILNQLTGDPIYREWGWEVFQAIERYCKTKYAYGGLDDVNNPGNGPNNKMESFFLAETLKYLYLLYDPDTEIDILNKHVFNTEAHPLRILDEVRGVTL